MDGLWTWELRVGFCRFLAGFVGHGRTVAQAEWRRTGLYQPSMKLKQAMRASAWDVNRRRSSSSHSKVAKTLSHIALS